MTMAVQINNIAIFVVKLFFSNYGTTVTLILFFFFSEKVKMKGNTFMHYKRRCITKRKN